MTGFKTGGALTILRHVDLDGEEGGAVGTTVPAGHLPGLPATHDGGVDTTWGEGGNGGRGERGDAMT